MADIQARKPIKKMEEETPPFVMEEEVTSQMEVGPKPVPVIDMSPKSYRCKTQCWVNKRVYEVGDVESFAPGEFVPEHFVLIE